MKTEKRKKRKEDQGPSPDVISDILEMIWYLSPEERGKIASDIRDSYLNREIERKPISFSWAGGLKDFRREFTSIELEKKALEWRTK